MPLQVTNQESGNEAANLTLQAAYVTNSAIDVTPNATDENQPMFILNPQTMQDTRVFQSSSSPCAVNTITVSIVTNVPLFVDCAPAITFSGLNSSSSETVDNITLLGESSTFEKIAWSRADGVPLALSFFPSPRALYLSFARSLAFSDTLHFYLSCLRVWLPSCKLKHSQASWS